MGAFLAERGQYKEALRTLDSGIGLDQAAGFTGMQADKLLSKAFLLYRLGDRGAARLACTEALGQARDPIRIQRGAAILARSGFAGEAEALLPRLKLDHPVPVFEAAAHRTRGEIMLARGQPALKEFEGADGLDPITANRVYLARALLLSARGEEAFKLYRTIAAAPADLLRYADERFPGIWSETLFDYGMLAFEMKMFDEAEQALDLYLRLRADADPDLPDVARAKLVRGRLKSNRAVPK
jgi:tetratricopeptide (TPR) repeat protein